MTLKVFAVATAAAVTLLLLFTVAQLLDEINKIENELDIEMDALKVSEHCHNAA